MNPGELNKRVTFQRSDTGQDGFGQPVEIWIDVVTVWASVNPIVGREFFAAETISSELTHKVKIRYRSGITPDMRIKFSERIFEIKAPPINYKENNTELQIMCKELV